MASFPIFNAPNPDNLVMDKFLSASNDLARSCRYAVVITRPPGLLLTGSQGFPGTVYGSDYFPKPQPQNLDTRIVAYDLTYLCEATEFPGRGFENLEVSYYGPKYKIPHRSEYEPLNMTFICTNSGYEREFFDEWMNLINPVTTFNFNFKVSYATNLRMFSFDEQNNPTYAFTLIDCFPILVNPQPVTWVDDNFLRLTVNFTYTKWIREIRDEQGNYTMPYEVRTVDSSSLSRNEISPGYRQRQ